MSTRTLTLDDGATTTIEQWGDAGPVILCVHGMTSSRMSWARLGESFGDRYRVVAYDQRGHGDSSAVRGPMTLERCVRDLQNVAANTGADVLVGHSWGGAVAIRAGMEVSAHRVVAIDPMIVQVDDRWYAEFIEELDALFSQSGPHRDARVRADYAMWSPQDVAGKVHAVASMTSAPIAGLRDQNRGGSWDLRHTIAGYGKPLLMVMAARESSIVPAEVLDDVEATHSSFVRIVTFEDQRHNLHRIAYDRFARTLEEFLRGR